MTENFGVQTRHQAKKLKEVLNPKDCNEKRRSYPPDHWTVEEDDSDTGVKQRRTLSVREQNTVHDDEVPTKPGACYQGARPKAVDRHRAAFQGQSSSAPNALQAKKKQKNNPEYQLFLSSLIPTPDSPFEIIEVPPSPPRHEISVPDDIEDIDEEPDSLNTNIYARDIMNYLMHLESFNVLKPDFIEKSPEVTTRMRGVLMDWILQVQSHEELKEETLHLTVALIDQTLSMQNTSMSKLQLVGITCLLIASKYHERFAPEINVLCYLTENTFEPPQVVSFEIYLLEMLDFRLSLPVTTVFLDRYLQVHNQPIEVDHLAAYIVDLIISSVTLVPVLPSLKAASALYLARFLLLPVGTAWDHALSFYTSYEAEDLHETAKEMAVLLIKAPTSKYQGARTKYNVPEFLNISTHENIDSAYILKQCFGKEVSSSPEC